MILQKNERIQIIRSYQKKIKSQEMDKQRKKITYNGRATKDIKST